MARKLARVQWHRQPVGPVGINWGHARAEGLAFFAPLSGAHGTRDLVQEQLGTRTGLEEYLPNQVGAIHHRFFASNRADFSLLPLGIGLSTPFTVAWTQEPRSGSGYSALLVVNFGTAGTDNQFTIYQSASDASYSMVTGPLGVASGGSSTPRFSSIGVTTNERLDRFVLQCSGGSQSVTPGDYVLWRNGERFTTAATAALSAYRTAAFRIGALSDGSDAFEGLVGDMRMWSRVLSPGEAEEESTVDGSWALYQPQRIWVPVSSLSPDITVNLSGQSVSVVGGAFTLNSTTGLSGASVTASPGSVSPGNSLALSGSAVSATAGTVSLGFSIPLLGESVTVSPGTITYTTAGGVTVALSGQAVVASAGSLGLTNSPTLSGSSVAASAGSFSLGISLPLSGSAVTVSAGTITYAPAGTVTITVRAGSWIRYKAV